MKYKIICTNRYGNVVNKDDGSLVLNSENGDGMHFFPTYESAKEAALDFLEKYSECEVILYSGNNFEVLN